MAETPSTQIGHNLRRLRDDRGWSRSILASESGTTEQTIVRAELYGANPRADTLAAWARAFGVSVGELFDGTKAAS